MKENYDTQELHKFASLAAHWWDVNGELKTLHQVNPLRLRYILEKINVADKLALDVGCGGGILTESLAEHGAKVTGIDLNQSLLDVAKLHQLESKVSIEYLHLSVEALADKRPAYYDVIACLEMLEHVPDPAAIISACEKLVKPGGHLFFSTLNRNMKSYAFAIIGAEHVLKILPKNTHDYAKFIRPSELTQWLREATLTPMELKGIHYSPLTQQFKLTNDISVNYLLHATKAIS
jgi:2-polyprenyl-6-hydroxyphenyl methylase/3-demethylubiquinone-9 3-methyltransferase